MELQILDAFRACSTLHLCDIKTSFWGGTPPKIKDFLDGRVDNQIAHLGNNYAFQSFAFVFTYLTEKQAELYREELLSLGFKEVTEPTLARKTSNTVTIFIANARELKKLIVSMRPPKAPPIISPDPSGS